VRNILWVAGISLSLVLGLMAQDGSPSATITNGLVHAKLYLPDAEHGYYRGVRSDSTGQASSPASNTGATITLGSGFPLMTPNCTIPITGPVEEFRTGPSAARPR
jgi:hypothetical protein